MSAETSEYSVLVVDDTQSNRVLYSTLLSHAGYDVRSAASGGEGLRLIAERQPSIVLLDYMMPGMNGADVIRQLRAQEATRTLPVVILTASLSSDDIEQALAAGADDYINKPVDSRILLARVKSIIRAHLDRERARAQPERDALRRELDEAQAVQRAQLPQGPVHWPGWCAVGAVVPSGQIAGDVFDAFETADGRGISFVLDVSGHGTASALVAAETRMALRALVAERSLTDAVTQLNARMSQRETGKYSCLAAVETRGSQVTVINAGLPPVLLWRAGQQLADVRASGFPVGLFADSEYEPSSLETLTGDLIVMMSDGVTDPYGASDDVEGALRRIGLLELAEPGSVNPKTLGERVRSTRDHEAEARRDDATVVVLESVPRLEAQAVRKLEANLSEIPDAVDWVVQFAPTWADRSLLKAGLTEALTNALVHGLLEVGSETRRDDFQDYFKDIQASLLDTRKARRAVRVEVRPGPSNFDVHLCWSGAPCPQEYRKSRAPEPWSGQGLGSGLIHASFSSVHWNSSGTAVILRLRRDH